MNYIPVDDLKPGQTFSHPVYIEDDTIFIPAGVPVREKDLERLRSWRVDQVETEGVIQDVGEFTGTPQSMWGLPADDELFRFYTRIIDTVDELLTRIRNLDRVTEKEIEDVVSSLIEKVEEKKVDAVRLVLTNSSNAKANAKSAVNNGLLAVTVGISLNRPRHKLFQLCSGALLHDVGMQRVPQDIIQQDRALDAQELKTLKTHPVYSYRIINKELQLSEEIAQIALQHHERWDGEGYPQGLSGTEIMFEARIVSVADAFEAMVSERPWRNSMIGYEAMRSILSDNQRRFDPEIVKIFIRAMGLYPVGSLVLLSDGSIGRVISSSEEAPLRPEVIILIASSGREYKGDTGPVIDLLGNRNLFIARALDIRSLIDKTKA
ncbi:MAG: HD-GYP domain-containing protein [Spirochaetaceae bacterium]|nr:HD-GYP domain-containing protein [Spirochaetaceae bacterium]MDT8296759.1 HD-GYP domain-containing protein [Spirochaetaceae bacterium]